MHATVQTVQIPGLAVADILVQHQRLVLGQDAHCVNAGIDTVRKRKVDDPVLSAKRHRGFCQTLGKRVQTRTLTACQQHCDTFFHDNSPLLAHRAFSILKGRCFQARAFFDCVLLSLTLSWPPFSLLAWLRFFLAGREVLAGLAAFSSGLSVFLRGAGTE